MRFTVVLVIFLCCISVIIEGSGVKNSKKEAKLSKSTPKKSKVVESFESESFDVELLEGHDDQEDSEFEFATSKTDMKKAWNAATKISGRNPNMWRLDGANNIILSNDFTISSRLAFKALIKQSPSGTVILEAVQEEYFGSKSKSNHLKALEFIPKNTEQDDLLSLIEIALMGNVADDRNQPYCWCPSLIHQDLFRRDDAARRWHMRLYDYDPKYGMAGHNLAFQHMGVGLKNIKNIPESALDAMDQIHTTMYIHNYQRQCADVVDQVNFQVDAAKMAEDIKNNWGLPLVTEFVERASVMPRTTRPAKLNKLISSSSVVPRTVTSSVNNGGTLSLSEMEWPSLSSVDSTTTKKKKLSKKTSHK